MTLRQRILIALGALLLLGIAGLLGFFWAKNQLQSWGNTGITLTEARQITLGRGESLKSFSTRLEQQGIVERALYFELWTKFYGDYSKFLAGPYLFEGEVSPRDVAEKISRGEIYQPVVLQFTIPEGFTAKQTAERLAALGVSTVDEILSLLADKEFLAELKVPATTLEGFIYPATYPFARKPTAREAIAVTVNTFWEKLPVDYLKKIQEKSLTLKEAVTFASLIELETQHEDEKPLISEVIWKRLEIGLPLGIDAAIIYGIKDYDGDIKWRHLKDASNPYNTRIHTGLPPTPIGSPSLSSLLAVLNPTKEGNLYYVLDADLGTRHHFSKSLKEHNKYVRKLKRGGR